MKTLKKITLFFILFLTVSCKSDDDATVTSNDSLLIGAWKLTSFLLDGEETTEEDDCDSLYTFTTNTLVIQEFSGVNCDELKLTNTTWENTIEDDVIIVTGLLGTATTNYEVKIIQLTQATLILEIIGVDMILSFERV